MSQAAVHGRQYGQGNSDTYTLRSEQCFHTNFDS
jgi:hypothetical protein